MEFTVVVEGNGDTNDKSIWEGQINVRVEGVTEILLSLTTVKNVMVSMNEDWWYWSGEVPPGRVKGRNTSGPRKVEVVNNSVLNGNWGFGTTVMFLDSGQVTYDSPEILDLCKTSTLKDKFLSDPKFTFTLEAYANDTPAPNILPKEANRVLKSIIDY